MGIFFFAVPFPIIIVAAGIIGFAGARLGRPEFAAIEHGGGTNADVIDGVLVVENHPEHPGSRTLPGHCV